MTEPRDDPFGDEGEDQNEDSAESESDAGTEAESSDKRVRDLQSKADKETARANKAESRLKALLEAAKEPEPEAGKPPQGDGGNVMDSQIQDMARMFAIQQHPKLAEYGYSASDLNGGSPQEIADGAAALVAQIEKIETQSRNKLLAENGLAPEIEAGAPPKKTRDFSKMSSEDFNKLVAEETGVKLRS